MHWDLEEWRTQSVSLLVKHFCSLTLLFNGKKKSIFNKKQAKNEPQYKQGPWHKFTADSTLTLGKIQVKETGTRYPPLVDSFRFHSSEAFCVRGSHHLSFPPQALCFLHQRTSSSAQKEPLNAEVYKHLAFLFWRYDHERCSSPGPPHEHLGVVSVWPAEGIGRNGLLVVEDVRLLLVGSTHQWGPGAERHVWVHLDVHPHPPPHRLQHDALLEERNQTQSERCQNFTRVLCIFLQHFCDVKD